MQSPSWRAIHHLEQLERENGVYGTFRIETEDGRRVESGLLPSLLATRDQLMAEVDVPPAHAERMREMMEDTFLESFFALDFPPAHTVPEGSREREYLVSELHRRGISLAGISRSLERFNADESYGEALRLRRQSGERVTLAAPTASIAPVPETSPPGQQGPDGAETTVDDQSVFSWRDGNNDGSPTREGQNLLNLLYHIAEDQARRDGYIHRGVTCNSCGAMPIQGIRYRCANCIDYDLCETCEAMQVHIKTHLFYKVRIPAPFLGNPRQSQPVWYPGKPMMLARSLPRPLARRLIKETNFENTELDALWDQFRCLANVEWISDPNKLGMAIDRKTFDRCFVPNTSIRPPPPSLIYDRMFAFYDTNGDNLIGFEEFLKGLASFNNKSVDERMRRIFRGYDIDGDGFVERKDFLRMFRAYYALSRELTRDMVAGMEDDFLEGGARDVVLGSQPISSAFPGSIPSGEASRTGEGKRTNLDGDMEIIDNEGVLRPDGADTSDRNAVIGDAAVREQFGRVHPVFPSTVRLNNDAPQTSSRLPPYTIDGIETESDDDDDNNNNDDDTNHGEIEDDGDEDADGSSESSGGSDQWPPAEHILEEDIVTALGAYVPLQEVMDRVDRARIGSAVYHRMHDEDQRRVDEARTQGIRERWQRRRFYVDEEDGATAPDDYQDDSDFYYSDGEEAVDGYHNQLESESHPPSPRSRSSSKVRFEDDLDDYDIRSNPSTSSRSVPVGERWGGFEVPEVEKDAGKEILYQVTQQGLNELLDVLFKPKEDLLMEVYRTRADRKQWAREIELVEQLDPKKATAKDDAITPNDQTRDDEAAQRASSGDKSLVELLDAAGYSVDSNAAGPVQSELTVAPSSVIDQFPEVDEDEVDESRPTQLTSPVIDAVSGSLPDPTLPQNRPDSLDLEPFPPPPTDSADCETTSTALEEVEDRDLTLPQFRPNEDAVRSRLSFSTELTYIAANGHASTPLSQQPVRLRFQPDGSTSFPAPSSLDSSSPEAEATAPKFSPTLKPSSSATSATHPAQLSPTLPSQRQRNGTPPKPPSPNVLSRWAYLNQVEAEAKERGGGAKLSFEEFRNRMNTDRGRRLGFVGSWIEMASF
jgi:hypothetical protein